MTMDMDLDLDLDMDIEKSKFKPTLEQEAILSAARDTNSSLMLTAMAGASKSTTLELLARAAGPKVPTCYVVFNKKNQLEAEKKFKSLNSPLASFGSASHVDIVTANALGHRAWSKAIGKRLILDTKKLYNIVKKNITDNHLESSRDDFIFVMQLVSKARHAGIGPRGRCILEDTFENWQSVADSLYGELNENHIYLARKSLAECIKQSYGGLVDFDDQVYMSSLFGGVFPRYENTYVDEAQDLSALNHRQIKFTAAGRLVCVGDPRQAIYAFRGADSSSMDNLRKLRDDWIDLPLSTTFRCPKTIVSRQQSHAPGFRAHDTNAEGKVLDLQGQPWQVPPGRVAILCRNNAPLFSCALRIIRRGLGCTILGGEIGKGLVTLSKKIVPEDSTESSQARLMITAWRDKEIALALVNNQESRSEIISDKAECLLAVIEEGKCQTMGEARRTLETMFSKDNLRITLSTGHKAKGLEWPTVIHLDPWRVPSKFAKSAKANGNPIPMEQDLNLRYVIETRAQEKLILASLEDFQEKAMEEK